MRRTVPILRSTVFRLKWASTPENEEATIWLASVATATAGGMPIKNNNGVIKKPPPTPNMPDKMPTIPPKPNNRKAFTEISAMGRYICMDPPRPRTAPKSRCHAYTLQTGLISWVKLDLSLDQRSLTYGSPPARGGMAFPTKPAKMTTVIMYGKAPKNWP